MPPKKETGVTAQMLLQNIREGKFSRVYLLEGEEEHMKDEALQALRQAILPPGMEQLNEAVMDNPLPDALIAACETIPFMADKRLIIVRDQPGLEGRSEADARLLDYLPQVPETTVLVFFQRGNANKTKALPKKIKTCGTVVTFSRLRAQELVGWVQQRFQAQGKACSPRNADLLLFTCGTDTGLLETEIAKIAAGMGNDGELTQDHIRAMATRSVECRVFDMIDCLISGKNSQTLRMMQDMLISGETRVGILAMLLRQFRLMQHLKIMQYEKVSGPALEEAIHMKGFQLEQLQRQAKSYNNRQIKQGVSICLETEYAFKSGRIPEDGCLEAALLRLIALRQEG